MKKTSKPPPSAQNLSDHPVTPRAPWMSQETLEEKILKAEVNFPQLSPDRQPLALMGWMGAGGGWVGCLVCEGLFFTSF